VGVLSPVGGDGAPVPLVVGVAPVGVLGPVGGDGAPVPLVVRSCS
jgi:hypothetical protein